jgi:hypothetical protein
LGSGCWGDKEVGLIWDHHRRFRLPAEEAEIRSYTIDDVIRVPIVLKDEDGVAHVRAIFRRMLRAGGIGPPSLDPDDMVELRGNGKGQEHATVEATLRVRDEHIPGDYLCVALQVYDSLGNMQMIKNPTPSKVFRLVGAGNRDEQKTEFLGWGD